MTNQEKGRGENPGVKEELPACLADIVDSFFGGSSSDVPAPRSPSTITGIDVEVGRAAFALLGVRDLDDIKHLSGAGIIAPESPETFCHLSDEVLSAAAAALSVPGGGGSSCPASAAVAGAARGEAPAEGLGLAAAAKSKAALASTTPYPFSVTMRSKVADRTERSLFEAFGKDAIDERDDPLHRRHEFVRAGSGGVLDESPVVAGGTCFADALSVRCNSRASGEAVVSVPPVAAPAHGVLSVVAGDAGEAKGGMDGAKGSNGEGGVAAPNPLKTVRITGTAEEVQLAEYLIRVRTARRDMVAA